MDAETLARDIRNAAGENNNEREPVVFVVRGMADEIASLRALVDEKHMRLHEEYQRANVEFSRAEAAEAEVERLRKVIKTIRKTCEMRSGKATHLAAVIVRIINVSAALEDTDG